MASRRIAASAINWAAIAERVPASQKTSFTAFKSKSDKYLRRLVKKFGSGDIIIFRRLILVQILNVLLSAVHFSVMANPENPPKIDWAAYKNSVPIAGMVDTFQKQYEALKVPYPADNISSQVDQQKQQIAKEIEDFKKTSGTRIAEHEKEIGHLNSLLPYAAMTMEDFAEAFPEQALDPLNRPTFWPHDAEEQQPRKEPESHDH
jgi:F-type H+-transporting ATPase subunit d